MLVGSVQVIFLVLCQEMGHLDVRWGWSEASLRAGQWGYDEMFELPLLPPW